MWPASWHELPEICSTSYVYIGTLRIPTLLASAVHQTQLLVLTNTGSARKTWTQALQGVPCERKDQKGTQGIKILSCFWSCYVPLRINQKLPLLHIQEAIHKNTSKDLVLEETKSFSVPVHPSSTLFRSLVACLNQKTQYRNNVKCYY